MNYSDMLRETWCHSQPGASPRDYRELVRCATLAASVRSALFEAIPLRQCSRSEYDGAPLTKEELERLQAAGQGNGGPQMPRSLRRPVEDVIR